ncbi:PGAP1-like protein-domain-containing protein [Desarmillaria tabescens]|uniref:GPI inositol-deacylase n=1 Tax=Armillaria tabescens TaxID=1929756 RepID=A0AA39NA18_ARMTA|nr:PGAP1-like protein-domain-containing protein [Desarmillaria tabescens]KAK0461784.1 PGAP1-like protein-domain-containing protein [Desarmillaria tabescens]
MPNIHALRFAMSQARATFLGLFSLVSVVILYLSALDVQNNLSPQGCRMSRMSPSYILQTGFNASWTSLANRYSLWLYREVGWESNAVHGNQPVLFIPGNAGSSRQVRSISSSAVRQFYSSPHRLSPEFEGTSLKPLDFFAVEFNEDLSAFHGPTMESETAYTANAIAYILSMYPPKTSIIILGHSMGGIIATSLLPSDKISAIITMSTPHLLPPARFDQRIDRIYDRNRVVLQSDPTPILSICGGATDMMIPSESCILERRDAPFRRTVFSSALEGMWTGVGHREMVWCHQVRWRVARAALELGDVASVERRGAVLDRWLRDGSWFPPVDAPRQLLERDSYKILSENERLVLDRPRSREAYLLPVSGDSSAKLTLYVSQGSVLSISPQYPGPLDVSVLVCQATVDEAFECESLEPSVLKLLPNPIPGMPFPVPHEGSDESEGVVLFEADLSFIRKDHQTWVGVRLDRADGFGWVIAQVAPDTVMVSDIKTTSLLAGGVSTHLPDTRALRISVHFDDLLSNALIVYRVSPRISTPGTECKENHLSPLLVHRSHPAETHYFPLRLAPRRDILLHTHSPAPYIDTAASGRGVYLDLLSSGGDDCRADVIKLEIAWTATVGRWASRYFTTIISWAIGIVSLIMLELWRISDEGVVLTPMVSQSLDFFCRRRLPALLLGSFVFSIVPLPANYFLGTKGELCFSSLAPLFMAIAYGLVVISYWFLLALLWPLRLLSKLSLGRWASRRRDTRSGTLILNDVRSHREVISFSRATAISMSLILLFVFLVIPWQVAFLGCWFVHAVTCASSPRKGGDLFKSPSNSVIISLMESHPHPNGEERNVPMESVDQSTLQIANNYNHNMHLLLLMTWLIPLAAPVLVVWIRTLATAGFTTPFDGDHFVLNVAPFLFLVDFASRTTGPLFEKTRLERIVSVRWSLLVVTVVAFVYGPKQAYLVFDATKFAVGLMVVFRIGTRYWDGSFSGANTRRTTRQ